MKISIVTPSYNSEKYITETIESIKQQSYKNFEHIIVDGKSTDNTVKILQMYPHLHWISEKDNGQTDALNKGFRLASGDILAWQNADDLYFPDTFEKVIKFFKENPETDIIYGYYELIDSTSNFVCKVKPIAWNFWLFKHGRFVPMQPTVFWRRKVYEEIGDLDTTLHYCMDVDFFAKASKKFKFSLVPQFLGKFRVHNQSKTQNSVNYKALIKEYNVVMAKNFDLTIFNKIIMRLFQWRRELGSFIRIK
ncbi:glycosyltransferase family 2 protein [Rhodocytophaga aerolata]|uniref:Glycosyltransferase family 2 protein n=1 Tax=Rhodocytophaga aerolata TaxID=455078 RepID=A0ABT8QZ83_9BACT|nr:glycosyltransferase family 2 protein [Rhodocytophaga aerolata]MDO1445146.1 glycosyltransferase family 2 protein [Rhodocytophaga aerolata]